jgi:hypothetical protein
MPSDDKICRLVKGRRGVIPGRSDGTAASPQTSKPAQDGLAQNRFLMGVSDLARWSPLDLSND